MYTRVPQKKPPQSLKQEARVNDAPISLPKNYSGNAFTEDGRKREFPSDVSPTPTPQRQIQEKDDRKPHYISPAPPPSIPIQNQSPLGYSDYPAGEYIRQEAYLPNTEDARNEHTSEEHIEHASSHPDEIIDTVSKPREGSLFSSLIPSGIFKNNFPFGHGLGSEELLLLGIMLSIYMSGEADGELMMLLCILLFAG